MEPTLSVGKGDGMEPDLIHNHVTKSIPEICTKKAVGPKTGLPPKLQTFCDQIVQIKTNDQVKALQTVLRDINVSRSDFIFYADRLIRMVVEAGLEFVPFENTTVISPTGCPYDGVKYVRGTVCGVSIMRSGEAMEQGLRDCCRSIRLGKILVQSQPDGEAKVFYAKFPSDVQKRKVFLMYPIIDSGSTLNKAVDVLLDHGVPAQNIILLTLFCKPEGLLAVTDAHPELTVLTTEVHQCVPVNFGSKYFGTY